MALTISARRPVDRAEEILTPEVYTDFLTTPAYQLVG